MDEDIWTKHRELRFHDLHHDPQQAHSAMLLLIDVDGIEDIHRLSDMRLSIRYDLRKICLQEIEVALSDIGFHFENSLFCKLKRALFYYTEETQRENFKIVVDDPSRSASVQIYQKHDHGCRDKRPNYWRKYL